MMNQTENSKTGFRLGKRFSILLTVAVVAAIVLINILFSYLAKENLWYLDMTNERYKKADYALDDNGNRVRDDNGQYIVRYLSTGNTFYTLSEDCKEMIRESVPAKVDAVNRDRAARGEEALKINLIFCADPDLIDNSDTMRYIHYTALCLKKAFPAYIDVRYINITKNPSAVQKYKATSTSSIYSTNVIVEFGSEFRIFSPRAMYTANDETSDPWAYNGEKKFVSSILAVTKAEAPICCITTNHGEAEIGTEFRRLIESAGYEIQMLDLFHEEIPENCRMIITYGPKSDFIAFGSPEYDPENPVSEIEKLDRYLDRAYSFMIFYDADTPALSNLDSYMEEWGISVARVTDLAGDTENYRIRDPKQCLDEDGYTLIGSYVTTGMGGSMTEDMRNVSYPAKVIFRNATAILPSPSYQLTYSKKDTQASDSILGTTTSSADDTPQYVFYSYSSNGVYRYFFDLFTSGTAAVAEADGKEVARAESDGAFRLITVTSESRSIQEDNYTSVQDASYVCAVASLDAVSDEVLGAASYGNTDLMLSTLRTMSKEIVPVNLGFKAFYITEMDEDLYDTNGAQSVTVWLTLLPMLITAVAGIIVTVRRKYL